MVRQQEEAQVPHDALNEEAQSSTALSDDNATIQSSLARVSQVPAFWHSSLEQMRIEAETLKEAGLWRTGEATLLRVLGIHTAELAMCRGLAWLLTADGWHGLGTKFARQLLTQLSLPVDDVAYVRTTVEEARHDTRADLVIRTPQTTIVIEAKIYAGEQPEQCDRISERWADENPTLVFLTPDRRTPQTAIASKGSWTPLAWSDLASIGEEAIAHTNDSSLSHGVYDLLATWKAQP